MSLWQHPVLHQVHASIGPTFKPPCTQWSWSIPPLGQVSNVRVGEAVSGGQFFFFGGGGLRTWCWSSSSGNFSFCHTGHAALCRIRTRTHKTTPCWLHFACSYVAGCGQENIFHCVIDDQHHIMSKKLFWPHDTLSQSCTQTREINRTERAVQWPCCITCCIYRLRACSFLLILPQVDWKQGLVKSVRERSRNIPFLKDLVNNMGYTIVGEYIMLSLSVFLDGFNKLFSETFSAMD